MNTLAWHSGFNLYDDWLFPAEYEMSWNTRLRVFIDDQHESRNWYFVHDGHAEGAGYFVGYDRWTNECVGYIGKSGFSSTPIPKADWFPVRSDLMHVVPYWSTALLDITRGTPCEDGKKCTFELMKQTDIPPRMVHVPAGSRWQVVDLSERSVKTLFESPEKIESVAAFLGPLPDRGKDPLRRVAKVVRTTEKIHLLDGNNDVLDVFQIPTERDRQSAVVWHEVGGGAAVVDFWGRWLDDDERNLAREAVYQISSDGTIAEPTELALERGPVKWHKQDDAKLFPWQVPAPAALALIEPLFILDTDYRETYSSAATSMVRHSWPKLVGLVVLSSLLAVPAWRRAQAFALPGREQIVWILFILLLGLPGYAGFLLHRRWPLRRECPHCLARIPWDREACALCGKPFPSAAGKGIEIFC